MTMVWQFTGLRQMRMKLEIEGEFAGMRGRFKYVSTAPTISKPCEHVTTRDGWFKKSLTRVHGAADGSATVERIETQ